MAADQFNKQTMKKVMAFEKAGIIMWKLSWKQLQII
jgi:hypothetical protein